MELGSCGLYVGFLAAMVMLAPYGDANLLLRQHLMLVIIASILQAFSLIYGYTRICTGYHTANGRPILFYCLEALFCISWFTSPTLLVIAIFVPAKHMWAPISIIAYLSFCGLIYHVLSGYLAEDTS